MVLSKDIQNGVLMERYPFLIPILINIPHKIYMPLEAYSNICLGCQSNYPMMDELLKESVQSNKRVEMFYIMIKDEVCELFPGCNCVSKLSFIIHIRDLSKTSLIFSQNTFLIEVANTKFLLLCCRLISKIFHIKQKDCYNSETMKDDPHNFLMYQLTRDSKIA